MNRHNLDPQETEREIWMMESSTKPHDQHHHCKDDRLFVRKMAVLILLLVSVLSMLMVYYLYASSSIASFLHYYYSLWVISYSVDINKCIFFLLCNGLLVFVAKSSASLLNDHTTCPSQNAPLIYSHGCYYGNSTDETAEESIKEVVFIDSDATVTTNSHHHHGNHEEEEEGLGNTNVHRDATDDQRKGEVVGKQKVEEGDYENQEVMEDEGKEDEQGMGVLSTEELNRKFDEFIRKMKEEIRTEAQLHLVISCHDHQQ